MSQDHGLVRPVWLRYAVAVAAAGAALAVTQAGWTVLSGIPFMLPILATCLSGWFGGGGPALASTAVSAAGIAYFFLPPKGTWTVDDPLAFVRLAIFIAVGAAISFLNAELWRTRAQRARFLERETAARASAEKAAMDVQRLAAIVESSEDAIISKTLDGIITSWNAAAEHLFGYTADEIIGQHISRIMPPERRGDAELLLGRVRRGERIEHFETIRVRRDGVRVPVSLSVSPIKDRSGRIVGASKIARDISERKLAQEERERLYQEAQEAVKARDAFLSVAGHEFRTPLGALRLTIDNLMRRYGSPEDERVRKALAMAERQVARLTRLTEDLLEVGRINAGKLGLDLEPVELGEVVREVTERLEETAARSGSRFDVDAVDPVVGLWDRSRIDQVVTNLLTNAVKFGGGKPIDVRVSGVNGVAHLTVRDRGIGIPREDQSRIFERFEQARPNRSYQGMGLGLWIARQIVEAHGGTIGIESRVGEGSEFRVELPADAGKG